MPDLTWPRRIVVALAACWFVGTLTGPRDAGAPASASREFALVTSIASTTLDGGRTIFGCCLDLYTDHPTLFWSLLIVTAVVLLAVNLHRLSVLAQRDPQRLFTVDQRNEMRRRAQGRCEHKHPLWIRCNRPGSHADHIYPWSRGGATSLSNGQWLCERHNLSKSNKIPSRLYIWRLQMRRRHYFPADEPRHIDWALANAAR